MTRHRSLEIFCFSLWLGAGAGCDIELDPEGPPPPADLGPTTDAPIPAAVPAEPVPGRSMYEGGGIDAAACLDGLDNDADTAGAGAGLVDCEDPACGTVAACAVGNGTRCELEETLTLDFTGCEGGALDPSCASGDYVVFGEPRPWVAGGMLYPGGTEFDSGLALGEAIDLRSRRIEITATFAVPVCGAGDACIESAAFGVASSPSFDATTRVQAHAALVYSGARGEVSLVLGGSMVASWPFDAGTPSWSLVLRPDGFAEARNSGIVGTDTRFPFEAPQDARVVAWGRNAGRVMPDAAGAALGPLTVSTHLCDIPGAWERRDAIALESEDGSAYIPASLGSVSIERGGSPAVLALAFDERIEPAAQSRIRLAEQRDVMAFRIRAGAPAIVPSFAWEAGGVRDPELHWDAAAATWHLFYTAIGDDGISRIGHASGATLDALTKSPEPALETDLWGLRFLGLEMPTVARALDGSYVLVVRAQRAEGGHELRAFVSASPDRDFALLDAGQLEAITLRLGGPQSGRFDAEEVASPSLRVISGAYHLYYTGRSGPAWAVALLASDDMIAFRDVSGTEPVLASRPVDESFDSIGVVDADLVAGDGEVWMAYVGTDGVSRTLGLAWREGFMGGT